MAWTAETRKHVQSDVVQHELQAVDRQDPRFGRIFDAQRLQVRQHHVCRGEGVHLDVRIHRSVGVAAAGNDCVMFDPARHLDHPVDDGATGRIEHDGKIQEIQLGEMQEPVAIEPRQLMQRPDRGLSRAIFVQPERLQIVDRCPMFARDASKKSFLVRSVVARPCVDRELVTARGRLDESIDDVVEAGSEVIENFSDQNAPFGRQVVWKVDDDSPLPTFGIYFDRDTAAPVRIITHERVQRALKSIQVLRCPIELEFDPCDVQRHGAYPCPHG